MDRETQTPPDTFEGEDVALFGLAPPPKREHDDRHPRDNPRYVAAYASAAQMAADQLAKLSNCQCERCKLKALGMRVESFIYAETLRAIYTDDTSKLERLAAVVEELKRS